jgi:hypothetical protein
VGPRAGLDRVGEGGTGDEFMARIKFGNHGPGLIFGRSSVRNSVGAPVILGSRDSSVGIATGYGREFASPGRVKIFTSPYRPDRLWSPPNLL